MEMALPDVDVERLITRLQQTPRARYARAMVALTLAERQALADNAKRWSPGALVQFYKDHDLPIEKLRSRMIKFKEYFPNSTPSQTAGHRAQNSTPGSMPPAPVEITEEHHTLARNTCVHIFQDWEDLNAIVSMYEAEIRRRWLKKTQAQRKQLLLLAWPNMSARHRPDLERHVDLESVRLLVPPGNGMLEESCWPYVNLEDLSRPESLLLFINSRARFRPHTFAYTDLDNAPLAKKPEENLFSRQDTKTMAFLGRDTPETYGAILDWEDHKAAAASVKSGQSVFVDHGHHILMLQMKIWDFLFQCVTVILRDPSFDDITTVPPFASCPSPRSDSTSLVVVDDASLGSLNVVARDAPYRAPWTTDWRHLYSIVKAQKDYAMDHVIAITEDPGCFMETVERRRNHRPELILDAEGNPHARASNNPLYSKVQRTVATDAYAKLFIWHELLQRICNLRDLTLQHGPNEAFDQDLHPENFDALVETHYFLESVIRDFVSDINTEFKSSPPLRKYHVRVKADNRFPNAIHVAQVHVDRKDTFLRRLLGLNFILHRKHLRDMFSLYVLLDELERLMQEEPRVEDLVSTHVASNISQLSIASECIHQLHQLQPWARKIEHTIAENESFYSASYGTVLRYWGAFMEIEDEFCTPKLFKLGDPTDGKFEYPAEQFRTRDTVNQMIAAETALAAFWKAANEHWKYYVGTTPAAVVKHIIGDRKPYRTQPWTGQISGLPAPDSSPHLLRISPDDGNQITGNFDKLAITVKDKKKTRGQASRAANTTTALDSTKHEAPLLHTLVVDKRSRKVFRSLFHSPHSRDQPGQVVWSDFLHAMVKAGFGVEKLQGSAWHFTPLDKNIERSIQFHEPHPSNKLPPTWARDHGRRLNKAFGWTGETFVLA